MEEDCLAAATMVEEALAVVKREFRNRVFQPHTIDNLDWIILHLGEPSHALQDV